jgi:hypothetical protein
VSATCGRSHQNSPGPGPLGYSRFPFSDAFLSAFFTRPLADRDSFLFSAACAVAPLSFIPASSFRHNVTFMYGVFASCTLSILSADISKPVRTLCLLFASCQCLSNHLHPIPRTFFSFLFDLILQRTHLIVLKQTHKVR